MTGRPVARRRWRQWSGALALVVAGMAAGMVRAQGTAPEAGTQPSIYSCTTPQGRHITSDRPIPECLGTGQRELTPSGGLKRIVPPVLTASERAREAERLRQETERQVKLDEEKRRNHALVMRYPNQAAHEQARREALVQIDVQISLVRQRLVKLDQQRQEINAELEFYRQDPGRVPAGLRNREQENTRQHQAQTAYLAGQLREREHIVTTFDDDLARLQLLWRQDLR